MTLSYPERAAKQLQQIMCIAEGILDESKYTKGYGLKYQYLNPHTKKWGSSQNLSFEVDVKYARDTKIPGRFLKKPKGQIKWIDCTQTEALMLNQL